MVYLQTWEYSGVKVELERIFKCKTGTVYLQMMRIFRCKTGTRQFTLPYLQTDWMVYLQMWEYSGVKLGPDVRIFRCKTDLDGLPSDIWEYSGVKLGLFTFRWNLPSDMRIFRFRIFRCKTGTRQFAFRCECIQMWKWDWMIYLQMWEYSGVKLGLDALPSDVRIFRCKTGTRSGVYLQTWEYSGVKLGPDSLPSDMRIFRCKTGTRQFAFRCENIQV